MKKTKRQGRPRKRPAPPAEKPQERVTRLPLGSPGFSLTPWIRLPESNTTVPLL